MKKIELVDAHFHLWDLQHPELVYPHLQPGFVHPLVPDLEKLVGNNYLVEDYISESQEANVTKSVHVQAAFGSKDPVKETEWLQMTADRTGFPHAIVAYSDLKSPRVSEELERHCQYGNVRGVRDFSDGDYLIDPDFQRGFATQETFNLVSNLDVKWRDMHKLKNLAIKFPRIPILLDHCGFPEKRNKAYFENWKRSIKNLSEAENVMCKISGLTMCDVNWTVESIRPWALHCIEVFGPERCLFASNWPVDKLRSTLPVLIDAYREIISGFSHDEQVAMFSGNAKKLYRI